MPPLQRRIIADGLRSSRRTVLAFVVVTTAASTAAVAAPLAIARVVDRPGTDGGALLVYFAVFAAAVGVARFLQDVRTVLTNQVQQRVATRANTVVIRALIDADSTLVDTHNPSRISSVVGSFNGSNKLWVQMFLMAFLGGILEVVLSFVVIGSYIDWTIGTAVVVYGFATTWLTLRANKITAVYLKLANRKGNESADLLGNVITNVMSLKIFGGVDWVVGLNDRVFAESRQGWVDFYQRRIGFGALQGVLIFTQYTMVFGLLLWQDGPARIGQLIVLVMVLTQLNRPFEMIATSMRDFAIAKSMAVPLRELLDEHRPPARTATTTLPPSGALDVVLTDVGFRYRPDAAPVLSEISAELRPGRMNFLVGTSGVGKSTLMRILLAVHRDYSGSITVGGVELSAIDVTDFWRSVGYVPQDPMMMNASIRENVLFGRDFGDDEIIAALATAELTAKLDDLDGGLDFKIGERGALLSGGERQRLALARALIGKPRLLLLDEASSALDQSTEAAIFDRLRGALDDTTVIAITHRTSIIGPTDRRTELTSARGPAYST